MVRASTFVALSYQILNARAANPILSNIVLSSAAGKWLGYSNRFAPSMPLSKGLAAVVTASQPGLSARPIPFNSWLMRATVARIQRIDRGDQMFSQTSRKCTTYALLFCKADRYNAGMRFAIRDLFWLTLTVAVGPGVIVWYDHIQSPKYKAQIESLKAQNDSLIRKVTRFQEKSMMLPLKERSILLGIPLDQGDGQGN
jgi:hypothetical protein